MPWRRGYFNTALHADPRGLRSVAFRSWPSPAIALRPCQYFPNVVLLCIGINMHLFLIICCHNILLPWWKYCLCDFSLGCSIRGPMQKIVLCQILSVQVDGYSHQSMNIYPCSWKPIKMIELLEMPHCKNDFIVLISGTLKYHFYFM